jgi:predicted metal-dependent phosphoesterase TrpH
VDLHSHSSFSDGTLPPEGVAHAMAEAGVAFAALTDHDTQSGLHRFREALAGRGIGFLSGVEISAAHPLGEVHILAYGFPCRSTRVPSPAAVSTRIRAVVGSAFRDMTGRPPPSIGSALRRIHRGGGLAFLAHPLHPFEDPERLPDLLAEMKQAGLDGIEAFYKPYPADVQESLARMASRLDLLVVGGSDFHGDGAHGAAEPGMDLPAGTWEALRAAVGANGGMMP